MQNRYNPGDVAIVHPYASIRDVESFLKLLGWEDEADDAFEIEHSMFGMLSVALFQLPLTSSPDQSLPDHLPQVTTLRTLFTRFLDINAVPRRSFFQYLRYLTADDLEREKLDEFLSPDGAVGNISLTLASDTL